MEFSVRQRTKTLPRPISRLEDLKEAACGLLKTEIKESLPHPLRLRLMGALDTYGTELFIHDSTQFLQLILFNRAHVHVGVRLSSFVSEKEQSSPRKRTVLDNLLTANCKKVKMDHGNSEPVGQVTAKSSEEDVEELPSISCSNPSSAFSSSEQEMARMLETEQKVSVTVYCYWSVMA